MHHEPAARDANHRGEQHALVLLHSLLLARPPGWSSDARSDLSFGLFQDPETPENRGFLVYLGLLGLRGSSGTARKQPESTKLGPRKSESLVGAAAAIGLNRRAVHGRSVIGVCPL